MQRTQRSTAGNIYKKRLEEIQMEAPRPPKSKAKAKSKKKPTKGTAKNGSQASTKRTLTARRTSRSSSSRGYVDSDEQPNTSLEQSDVEFEFEDGDGNTEVERKTRSSNSSRSSSRTSPVSRASLRIQKGLINKFNCPHCKATFAEERYVEFHCKEVHKNIIQEEKKLIKQTVKEARNHYRQLSQRPQSNVIPDPDPDTSPRQTSDSDDGEDQGNNSLDLPNPPEFDLNEVSFDDEEPNVEDYYETKESGDVDMYKCKKCPNFQVASKHVIATHIKRHISASKIYRCPYCEFKANNRASLDVHMYTHTRVKPFCCKDCDLPFKCKNDLLSHCKISHGYDVGPVAQDPPGVKSQALQFPSGTSSSRSHKCPFCTQVFMSSMNLDTHISIHRLKGLTDEQKKEDLRSREAYSSETIEEPEEEPDYRCIQPRPKRRSEISNPSKVKKSKEEVEVEMENPSGKAKRSMISDGPPRCTVCSKFFLYTTSIEKHMREVHNITPQEAPKPTRFFAEEAGVSIDSNETSTLPTSPPPLTPIITSVVSRAGAADALKTEGSELELHPLTLSESPSSNGVKKSPPSKATNATSTQSAQIEGKDKDPTKGPMKSVYLLFDPGNNTVIPVSANLVTFPNKGKSERVDKKGGAEQNLAFEDSSGSCGDGDELSDDGQPLDEPQSGDSGLDSEIANELKRIGKPGAPLSEGADNQNLEHQCSLCQTKIVGYTEIVKHFHTHTVGDDFNCHLCSKRFSSKASLGIHFLIHVGITFSCPICHKKLAKKQSLLEHMRFHRGERRHNCTLCAKAFITSSSLNRHIKTHDPALVAAPIKFKCKQCPRGFHDQPSFAQHLRAHDLMSRQSPIPLPSDPNSLVLMPCEYCGTVYGSAIGLSRHLKTAHANQLGQVPIKSGRATAVAAGFLLQQNMMKTMTPPASAPVQPQVILTAAEPSAVKIIDVIDLSDDEEGNQGNEINGGGDKGDSEMMDMGEIPTGNKVNLDGEDVDAIEVVTTEVSGGSPMESESETLPDAPAEVEVSTTAMVKETEQGNSTTSSEAGEATAPEANSTDGSKEDGLTQMP